MQPLHLQLNKIILIGLFIAVLLIAGSWFLFDFKKNNSQNSKVISAQLKSVKMTLIVADTPLAMSKGLSGVKKISDQEGMLFVFPTETIPSFWMKDMLMSIDIIWLDKNMRVVGFVEKAMPDSYPKLFSPNQPIRYVLEVNSGWSERYGLQVGDQLQLLE